MKDNMRFILQSIGFLYVCLSIFTIDRSIPLTIIVSLMAGIHILPTVLIKKVKK